MRFAWAGALDLYRTVTASLHCNGRSGRPWMGPERLVRSAVEEQFAMGGGGSMFMDAPVELGLAGMTALALADEKRAWREMTRQLR